MDNNIDVPRLFTCDLHGETPNFIRVDQGEGYPHNGYFCQKCYVENVIVPNCRPIKANLNG